MFHVDTLLGAADGEVQVVRNRQQQSLATLDPQFGDRQVGDLGSQPDVFKRDLLQHLDELPQRFPGARDEGLLNQRLINLLALTLAVAHAPAHHDRRRANARSCAAGSSARSPKPRI